MLVVLIQEKLLLNLIESGYSEFDEIDVGYLDAYWFGKDGISDGNQDKITEIVDCVDRELEAIDGEEEDTNKIIIDCENELNSMQSDANANNNKSDNNGSCKWDYSSLSITDELAIDEVEWKSFCVKLKGGFQSGRVYFNQYKGFMLWWAKRVEPLYWLK